MDERELSRPSRSTAEHPPPPSLTRIPDVQVRRIGGSRNPTSSFPGGPIQRRTNILFLFRERRQRDFDRSPILQLIKIIQNRSHNLFVLTISALRDIGLHHGLEMHTGLIGTGSHGRSLPGWKYNANLTLTYH